MKMRLCVAITLLLCLVLFACTQNPAEQSDSYSDAVTSAPVSAASALSPHSQAGMQIISEVRSGDVAQITVYSEAIADSFVLDVLLPPNYDQAKRYPTLYLSDGNWRRGDYDAIRALWAQGTLADVILVGICYPEDYDLQSIRVREFLQYPEIFLSFIVQDIVPYIDASYSTLPDTRYLCGASYGGYFTLYAMFHDLTRDVFTGYVVASPALLEQKDGKNIFDREADYHSKNTALPVNLYMSLGEFEYYPDYIKPFFEFCDLLDTRGYDGLSLTSKQYEGIDHYGIWTPTILDALRLYFPKE